MQSKTMGIILLVVGLLMMVYTGFTYITKEKVVDIGPIEVSKEKEHPIQWSPIVGGIFLLGGLAILVSSKGK